MESIKSNDLFKRWEILHTLLKIYNNIQVILFSARYGVSIKQMIYLNAGQFYISVIKINKKRYI